jgi:ferric-dicitrate binding protein FerR (iron transport regulator)
MTHDHDRDVALLIRRAGARPAPSDDRTARVRAATTRAWKSAVRERRLRRWYWAGGAVAAAAGLIVAVAVWRVPRPVPQPLEPLAVATAGTFAAVSGNVSVVGAGGLVTAAVQGAAAPNASVVNTGEGSTASMRLDAGGELRLAAETRMALTDRRTVRLERGTIYIDSEGATPGSFTVITPAGIVRDIGTRFEVRVSSEALTRVRVREGAVQLERGDAIHRAPAGTELSLADGVVRTRAIAAFDPEWHWTTSAAPAFTVEGATLESFLTWVEREGGFSIDSAAVPARLRGTILHGSVSNMTPGDALRNVLPACGLTARFSGGRVTIVEAR